MVNFLKGCSTYGVWDIISLLIIFGGFIWGLRALWIRRKSLSNFTVFFNWRREKDNNFPLHLVVEFTNRTQQPAFISGLYFVPKSLRPDPNARYDSGSGKMEMKFPEQRNVEGRNILFFEHFDVIIENDKTNFSFACIDPSHTDEEIKHLLDFKRAGNLYFYLILLNREEKPRVHKFKVPAYKKYDYGYWERIKYLFK